jgi:hypothetical protein
MEFAFLDESGDLGARGSKHLVLTLLITSRKKELIKIVRETKRELLRKNKCSRWLNRHAGEIKYYGFPDKDILKRALRKISEIKSMAFFIALEKNGCSFPQHAKTHILASLFRHIQLTGNTKIPQKIIADLNFFNKKKINRFLFTSHEPHSNKNEKIQKEDSCCREKISFTELNDEDYKKMKNKKEEFIIEIEHRNSRICEELQALDFICGGIFAYIERNESNYINILRSGKLKIEGLIVPKKR